MCSTMNPGNKCPLDGEVLCRNARPTATGMPPAGTPACTPVALPPHSASAAGCTLPPVQVQPAQARATLQ